MQIHVLLGGLQIRFPPFAQPCMAPLVEVPMTEFVEAKVKMV